MKIRFSSTGQGADYLDEGTIIDFYAIDYGVKGVKSSLYESPYNFNPGRMKNDGIAFQAYECFEFDSDLFPLLFDGSVPEEKADEYDVEIEAYEKYESDKINNALSLTASINREVYQYLKNRYQLTPSIFKYCEQSFFKAPDIKIEYYDQDFSDIFKEILDNHGITQHKLSELTGISNSAIGRMINPESDNNLPDDSQMIKIAIALKLTSDEYQRLSRKNPHTQLVDYRLGDIIFKELLEKGQLSLGNGKYASKADVQKGIKKFLVYTLRAASAIHLDLSASDKQIPKGINIDDYVSEKEKEYILAKPKCEVRQLSTSTSDTGKLFVFSTDYPIGK